MVLLTPRLRLREFTLDDAPALHAYQRDPRYRRFYPALDGAEPDTLGLLRRFVAWRDEEPRGRYQLAVTLADTGELIGNVGLRRPTPRARTAEAGFELAPDYWGRGYATEAARALVAYGFGELGLHRVYAHCIAENHASARVLRRLGMRVEGTLREHEYFRDRWWDVLLFAVLESEWSARPEVGEPPSPTAR